MFDAYSKVVLTVIAVALSGICVRGLIRGASAQIDGCGGSINPCYITTTPRDLRGINVYVTNWPLRVPY
jgi:hypothetical protein